MVSLIMVVFYQYKDMQCQDNEIHYCGYFSRWNQFSLIREMFSRDALTYSATYV